MFFGLEILGKHQSHLVVSLPDAEPLPAWRQIPEESTVAAGPVPFLGAVVPQCFLHQESGLKFPGLGALRALWIVFPPRTLKNAIVIFIVGRHF